MRHAYDRGVRFFETADSYRGMPQMLATALKGIPRDSYRLMTKFSLRDTANPKATIDRLRADLGADYVDILLIHCVRSPGWAQEQERLRDEFSEAKAKKVLLAHGASCHGLQPLRTFPGNRWLDVALMRVNPVGTKMDTMSTRDTDDPGDVKEVVTHIKAIHGQRTGVLGMKLIGEGQFTNTEQRAASFRFVMGLGSVDAVTVGFRSPAEIDEAIENMDRALNS